MKILFFLLFLIPIFIPAYAANIVIVEVEPNPAGPDSGKEWARLFNPGNESVNLSGWIINSTHAETKTHNLSGIIGACTDKMINFRGEFLDNENESIILYDNTGQVVDSTPKINDKANSSITWTTKEPKCEISLNQDPENESPPAAPAQLEPVPEMTESSSDPEELQSEIIEKNEKEGFFDFGISIEKDEEFIDDLDPMLPYLGIGFAVIIGGIIVLLLRNSRKEDDPSEVKDVEKDMEIEIIPMSKKFQDMQTRKKIDGKKIPDLDEFVENKILIIETLQKNKLGNYEKLEKIKKSLKSDGSFTLKDNKYLETVYSEYEKVGNKKSGNDRS